MIKHRKRLAAGAVLLAALLMLSACAKPAAEASPEAAATAVPTAAATAAPTASPDDSARQAVLDAYRTALTGLMQQHVLPDGTEVGYDDFSDTAQNQFAVLDVDGDGRDELVIAYTTTYMAGQTGGVFEYDADSGQWRTELTEFPMLTFFNNGVIEAGWSHNQGLAVSFWPYSLYQYDAARDGYLLVGMADAWEKAFQPQDYEGNPYPDDVDVSGTGLVYYIMENGANEQVAPVDATAYTAWRASFLGNAAELSIPYMPLTDENIAAMS